MQIVVLPGDGVGPEVIEVAEQVLLAAAEACGIGLSLSRHLIGAAAVEVSGTPLPRETRDAVVTADAVLLGAVGDPSLDAAPRHLRPETGLLALRSLLGVYANLRPASLHPALIHRSPLRPERLQGTDLLIVRELTGGLYYGEPRALDDDKAINTLRYSREEIVRVAGAAFQAARLRRRKLLSVDKANVLETSQLWRRVVTEVAQGFPDVELEHGYVDATAMRLVTDPASIDVLLTENLFGDILSDEAAVLVGSIGLLPSASLGDRAGLYEPVHGSAPGLAGKNVANPIGAILSTAMLLRYSARAEQAARMVEAAVYTVLAQGGRTRDLVEAGEPALSTREIGTAVLEALSLAGAPAR